MALETMADAVGVTRVLYQGRSKYLLTNLEWWCRQIGPHKALLEVTPEDIDAGIQVLLSTPALKYRRGGGVMPFAPRRSNGTINKYVGALATMYKLLRMHRRLPRTFVSPLARDMKLPEGPGRTVKVTIEDVHRLVDSARLSRNRKLPALIAVACTTGLRLGSLQALTWGDVDLRARTIDVATTKNGLPTRSIFPLWVGAELTRIRPENPEKHWEVFGRKAFKKAWDSSVERADLPVDWTFHHTRHIAASILAQSGASLPVIMQALNHKTPSMAIRYSHLSTKSLDIAITSAWG